MRYKELFEDINLSLKNDITNLIVNLQSQGVNKITIPQILDNIRSNSDYNGLAIDSNAINDVLETIDNVTVSPDMDNNGVLTVQIDTPDSLPTNNKKSNEDKVTDMAQNTIQKDME